MDENGIAALIGTTQCIIASACCALNILIVILCMLVAQRKNRSVIGWGALGFFFSIFALLVLLLLPTIQPRRQVFVPVAAVPYQPYPPSPAPYAAPQARYSAPPPAVPAPPHGSSDATMIHSGWRLTIVGGPDTGQSYALNVQARLGRGVDNEIRLSDPQVSRNHALIQRQGDHYAIIDQGSGNGTYVNGKLISAPTQLAPSDTITLGNTQITVG